jgi:GH18 family chitinase
MNRFRIIDLWWKQKKSLDFARLYRSPHPFIFEWCACAVQENASLREQTDELQAQLLHRHVEEGRQLLLSSSASSIAAELENVSQDEVRFACDRG